MPSSPISITRRHQRRPRMYTFILPVVAIGTLQLAGCTQREIPPPDPGGAYLSQSGGAQFEQSVELHDETSMLIGHIDNHNLSGIHRTKNDPSRIYAISSVSGVVVSTDSGQTWRVFSTPLTRVTSIVELENGIIIVAGSNEDLEGVALRSLDQGKSWDQVLTIPAAKKPESGRFEIIKAPDPAPVFVSSLAIDPFINDKIYATTSIGDVLFGTESGKVWSKIFDVQGRTDALTGRTDAPVRSIIPSPHIRNELLLITSRGDLIRSRQGEPIHKFKFEPNSSVTTAVYVQGRPETILIGTQKGALITNDAGETWQVLTLPISAAAPLRNTVVRVSPTNENRIIISADSVIYRSEDGGKTWNSQSLDLPSHAVSDISIDPSNAANVILTTFQVRT